MTGIKGSFIPWQNLREVFVLYFWGSHDVDSRPTPIPMNAAGNQTPKNGIQMSLQIRGKGL
jgi:hypothetical protein